MSLPSLKVYHKASYPAISPTRPELSQAGKTILITGGNSGIGYAIAQGFIAAASKRVIILGRRAKVVDSATTKLTKEALDLGSKTIVDGRVCDIASLEATEKLWNELQEDRIVIDVLVLNAAAGGISAPILKNGRDNVWADFESNVRSALDLMERFQKQPGEETEPRKFVVNLSSTVAYMWSTMAPERPSYGLTKSASTLLLQQIAKDTPVDQMQIVSFHPGGVLTDMARRAGFNEDMGIPFDNENLPGHFAVWAASREAEFLHGRFVWANWDVAEIKEGAIGERIRTDPHFLKVGIEGLTESTGNPLRYKK